MNRVSDESMLEPYIWKHISTVPRGVGSSNVPLLPDIISDMQN